MISFELVTVRIFSFHSQKWELNWVAMVNRFELTVGRQYPTILFFYSWSKNSSKMKKFFFSTIANKVIFVLDYLKIRLTAHIIIDLWRPITFETIPYLIVSIHHPIRLTELNKNMLITKRLNGWGSYGPPKFYIGMGGKTYF